LSAAAKFGTAVVTPVAVTMPLVLALSRKTVILMFQPSGPFQMNF